MMNFDLSKENIQPLRGGRNIAQLEIGLQANSDSDKQKEIQSKKLSFESEIENYQGDDPLELWYDYISWTEQTFPKQGHEGSLIQLLEKCLTTFESDPKYAQDRRFCRLWIKYTDLKNEAIQIFQLMHSKNLCTQCADFYRAWAYNYEINGDFRLANMVIELGLKNYAEPYVELALAHKNLMAAILDSVLKKDTSNNTRLVDERRALTSLHSFRQGRQFVAPTVRVGQSIMSMVPGTLPSSSILNAKSSSVKVYTDDENHESELLLNKHPNLNLSIIESVKSQENQTAKEVSLKSAGTWCNKKMKKILQSNSVKSPPFKVHEDNAVTIDDDLDRIHLPPNFCSFLDDPDLKTWNVPRFISEPPDPNRKVMYRKEKVYRDNDEFSFEEINAEKWFQNRQKMLHNLDNVSMDCEVTKYPTPNNSDENSPSALIENFAKNRINSSLTITDSTPITALNLAPKLQRLSSPVPVLIPSPAKEIPTIECVQQEHNYEETTATETATGTIISDNNSQSKLSQEVLAKKAIIFGHSNESLTVHTKDVLSKINECWNNNLSATITTGGIPVEEEDAEDDDDSIVVEIVHPPKASVFEIHEDTILGQPTIKSSSSSSSFGTAKKRKPLQVKEMSSSSSKAPAFGSIRLPGEDNDHQTTTPSGKCAENGVGIEIYEDVLFDERDAGCDINHLNSAKKRKPLQVKEMSSSSTSASQPNPSTGPKNVNFSVYREVADQNETVTAVHDVDNVIRGDLGVSAPEQPKPNSILKPSELTDIVFSQPMLPSKNSKRGSIITGLLSTNAKATSCPVLNLDDTCVMDKSVAHPNAASTPFNTNAKSRIVQHVNGPLHSEDQKTRDKLPSILESKENNSSANTMDSNPFPNSVSGLVPKTTLNNHQNYTEQSGAEIDDLRASCMQYLQNELSKGSVNPFATALRDRILDILGFPMNQSDNVYVKINTMPRLSRKETITLGNDHFQIERQLGKGNFGTVFKAIHIRKNKIVALKYQKPAHLWELYICKEIQNRLINPNMKHAYMDIDRAYFSPVASVFLSQYSKFGSLLDVRNAVKKATGKPLSEAVVLYFANEILRIVEALHNAKIIHADLKPDNFLVTRLPPESGRLSLQLIDFGSSIDMLLFPKSTEFYASVTTEDFICSEMREGRSWTYQTDLYCLAATVYCLLFEKYMQVRKQYDCWTLTQNIPRYMKTDVWNEFFTQLLNVQSCNQMPNLKSLRKMIDNAQVSQDDLAKDFRNILNIVQKR